LSEFILETRGLTKEFKGFVAVSNVDLKVRTGHIHALIGPNGAGKTTVLQPADQVPAADCAAPSCYRRASDVTGDEAGRGGRAPRSSCGRSRSRRCFRILSVLENVRVGAAAQPVERSFDFWRSATVAGCRRYDDRDARAARGCRICPGYADTVTAGELPYGRKRALEIATTLALDPVHAVAR
jgi:branched-chain amino acid transport system ATP-binding protein